MANAPTQRAHSIAQSPDYQILHESTGYAADDKTTRFINGAL